jgi:hypothetical protein
LSRHNGIIGYRETPASGLAFLTQTQELVAGEQGDDQWTTPRLTDSRESSAENQPGEGSWEWRWQRSLRRGQ